MNLNSELVKLFLSTLLNDNNKLEKKISKTDQEKSKIKVHRFDKPISFDKFFNHGLIENNICIFSSWLTKSWSCRNKLISKNIEGKDELNHEEMLKVGADSLVPVSRCSPNEEICYEKDVWKLNDYLNYLKSFQASQNSAKPIFYLKDWHFTKQFPDFDLYDIPTYFSSDWLNEMWDKKLAPFDDDFRFVYIGPKSSWTPFHADVYRSYSWSSNICGQKKWLFVRPGVEDDLRDKYLNMPCDIRKVASDYKDDVIEVVQEAGETIFVPSRWFHQVHNLETTVSINHNWLNACNVGDVWKFLKLELADVEKAISDCYESMTTLEWLEHCQIIMKANTGINYIEFFALISNVVHLRLQTLKNSGFSFSCSSENSIEDCSKKSSCNLLKKLLENVESLKSDFPLYVITDLSAILKVLDDLLDVIKDLMKDEKIIKNNCILSYKEVTSLYISVYHTLEILIAK